ncbi:hypothetical protein [Sphingomonas sp. LY160]|uniref:hypothetical protein n=1 Tax=Sphingomonas sp. LY160 TaxID=3095342 RepID=UPI002ADEF809|nr:hypothetical protein [Sphingomonas sp. LY160]MEA1071397.1 hypothetical protein [Sphingomonas sp. LY160]
MRLFSYLPAVAVLILSMQATEAAAQMGGGRSGMSTAAPLTNVKPYKELQNMGACVARYERKKALTLIATVPGSKEEEAMFDRLFFGERETCMPGGAQMVMPVIFARGALAEGLLSVGGVPDTLRLKSSAPQEVKDLHGAARCYTSGNRNAVATLLKTTPGSPEEIKAVAGLWNDFRTCMPGFNVRLNAPWIRFLLAEALLRLEPGTTASGG